MAYYRIDYPKAQDAADKLTAVGSALGSSVKGISGVSRRLDNLDGGILGFIDWITGDNWITTSSERAFADLIRKAQVLHGQIQALGRQVGREASVLDEVVEIYWSGEGKEGFMPGESAKLMKMAYDDHKKGQIVDGYMVLDTYDWAGMEAIILEKDGEIFVTFRGSQPLLDWKALFSRKRQYEWLMDWGDNAIPGVSYQEEFSRRMIEKVMKDYPDKKINLTGHSLGGSNALAAASEIARLDPSRLGQVDTYNARPNQTDCSSLRNHEGNITNNYVEGDLVGDTLYDNPIWGNANRYGTEQAVAQTAGDKHNRNNF